MDVNSGEESLKVSYHILCSLLLQITHMIFVRRGLSCVDLEDYYFCLTNVLLISAAARLLF